MNKLEIRMLIEDTGNYEEEEIDEIIEIYEELAKHIGWKDERRDSRYIVKFHDIFWYMNDEWEKEHEGELNYLFDEFCYQQNDYLQEEFTYKNIDVESLLTRMCVGHYQAFNVDMPYIEEDNILDLAMKFYDEYNYEGRNNVKNQIYVVETLKSLEDNYMEYWFEFLEDSEFPAKILKEMREKYNKERKKK